MQTLTGKNSVCFQQFLNEAKFQGNRHLLAKPFRLDFSTDPHQLAKDASAAKEILEVNELKLSLKAQIVVHGEKYKLKSYICMTLGENVC